MRRLAPDALILVVNVPNLALLTIRAHDSPEHKLLIENIAAGFASETNKHARLGVTVVDVMCDPRAYDPAYFAADGFHAKDRGYELLAEHLAEAVRGAVEPPPSSCPQMTAVRAETRR